MKKVILFLVVGIGALCTLSSCLQNEEPAGVENLRNAKSELIKAEAQYKAAEIALVQAEAALKETIRAGYELDNKLKELDVQLKEAQVAYELARIELQKAQDAAANEVELAKLQNDLLAQEIRKQKLENQKELVVEEHKEALLKAQKAVAEAEKAYQDVLDEINSVTTELTEAEKTQLAYYTQQVEAIRTKLNTAQTALVEAQQDLIDAKYNYNEEKLRIQYTRGVAAAQEELDNVKELLAEASEIDLTGGATDWMTKKEEIDTRIEELEKENLTLEVEADEKRQEKTDIELAQAKVQFTIDSLGTEIQKVQKASDELYAESGEKVITVDNENIFWNVYYSFYYALAYLTDGQSTDVWDLINFDPETGTITLKEKLPFVQQYYYWLQQMTVVGIALGLQEYVGQSGYNYRDNIEYYYQNTATYPDPDFRYSTVNDYIFSDTQISHVKDVQAYLKSQYEAADGYKAMYAKYVEMYNTSMKGWLEAAATYGVVYDPMNDSYYLPAGSANEKAQKALDDFNEALASTTAPTDPQITEWINAIRTEQSLRDQMYGASWSRADATDPEKTLTFADFTLANYKAGTITLQDLTDAVNMTVNNPVVDNYYGYPTHANASEEKDWGLAQQWAKSSYILYSNEYLRTPLTDADREGLELYVGVYEENAYVSISIEQGSDLYKKIAALYSGVSDSESAKAAVEYSLWYQDFYYAQSIAAYDQVLAYQDDYKAVAADLTALFNEYKALADEKLLASNEFNEKLLSLYDEQKTAQDKYEELGEQITKIDAEAVAIDGSQTWSQVSVNKTYIKNLSELSESLKSLIEGIEIEIPAYGNYYGTTLHPDAENLAEEFEKYVAALEKGVEEKEDALRDAEVKLSRLEAGEDSAIYAVEDAELAVEQAQEEYDYLLEQFNFYNDLLKELMAAIIGGEELPETPETPAA